MEVDWVCKRAHLYTLLQQHPNWSVQQLADAVGCSKSMISKWKNRLTHADLRDTSILFSRSRAAHRHPVRLSKEVIETIIEMRLSPPEHLHRTPGPKALLYYLPRDERLQSRGFRLPRSTRTIWQILDQTGLIDRAEPVKHSPLPIQELTFPGSGHQTAQEEEVRRLKRELDIVKQERDILKKAPSIFSRKA